MQIQKSWFRIFRNERDPYYNRNYSIMLPINRVISNSSVSSPKDFNLSHAGYDSYLNFDNRKDTHLIPLTYSCRPQSESIVWTYAINSNLSFLLEDDPTPARNDQVTRAASLVISALSFVRALRREELPPDSFRGTPLCMVFSLQYYSDSSTNTHVSSAPPESQLQQAA